MGCDWDCIGIGFVMGILYFLCMAFGYSLVTLKKMRAISEAVSKDELPRDRSCVQCNVHGYEEQTRRLRGESTGQVRRPTNLCSTTRADAEGPSNGSARKVQEDVEAPGRRLCTANGKEQSNAHRAHV